MMNNIDTTADKTKVHCSTLIPRNVSAGALTAAATFIVSGTCSKYCIY